MEGVIIDGISLIFDNMKALFQDTVIAESDHEIVIEGNHYFPKEDVHMEYLNESNTTSVCPWKGDANYFNITVDGNTENDGAWTYHNPKEAAKEIKDYIAFWKNVIVKE